MEVLGGQRFYDAYLEGNRNCGYYKEEVPSIIEDAIAKDADTAYRYASRFLTGPFEKGEAAIAKKADVSFAYAVNVLGKRFEAGEKAIAKSDKWSFSYALYMTKGRLK